MESFIIVAIISFSFAGLISYFWIKGLDYMIKNHPDYKADDFLTIHRLTQDKEQWMWSQIHVRKIKETETGGCCTPFEEPIKIKMIGNH